MKTFAPAMLNCLRTNFDALAREGLLVTTQDIEPGEHAYTLDEISQIVAGFVEMIAEAAEERPPETFNLYMDAMVPSFIRSGSTPAKLVNRVVAFGTQTGILLSRELPREIADEAGLWFSGFMGRYASQLAASAWATARALGRE